jgi:hypothetical protein
MVLTLKDILDYIFEDRSNPHHIGEHGQRYTDIGNEWKNKHPKKSYKLMDRDGDTWRTFNESS